MPRLLSVNVGLPRDISWRGRTVHTGIWKEPVQGRCRLRRLNLDGDGQGDLAGHGGEQRAVFAYQIDSYRHWERELRRSDLVPGQFGESFTIEGLPDDAVCIGDRYRVGGALLEVTQPRVTCYRVGIRMNEPRMPSLLTGSGRPGFYFRVLEEGDVGARDEIVKVGQAQGPMTVAEINALLYSSSHPRDRLERALLIEALSPGWRSSFEAMLAQGSHAGLAPEAAGRPVAQGFTALTVTGIEHECADVLSFTLERADGAPLPDALPGQYIAVRLRPAAEGAPLLRSYSLSGPVSTGRHRISVKIEPGGRAGACLKDVRVGQAIDASAPRGSFTLRPGDQPVVLLSAGIGVTPVLAMLHALAREQSSREVLWLHTARDGAHHPFAAEARHLVQGLPHGHSHICYSRPRPCDRIGTCFDAVGHLSRRSFEDAGLPATADVYLCGPNPFMAQMKETLGSLGMPAGQVHAEIFNGGESLTPGVIGAPVRPPHAPRGGAATGPRVSFARSGLTVHWAGAAYGSILELAEACDVPVRWSCRTGVCHNCESGLVSGTVDYAPEPLEMPPDGNVLICCSRPHGDIVVDL